MREHALPQDVTGYKFHIIGNMTLKQFAEVAAGFVVAFLIYQTNLPLLLKWPLIVIFAALGVLVAFVPIEERPLDQWITAFFRALYRPTQFYWKRMPKIPEPFLYEPRKELKSVVGEVDLSPARRNRVKEYLRSIETPTQPDQFEIFSSQRLQEVVGVFQGEFQGQPGLAMATQTEDVPTFTEEATAEAIENLSFVGRATGEQTSLETDIVPGQEEGAPEETTVLNLFDDQAPTISPETIASASPVVEVPQTLDIPQVEVIAETPPAPQPDIVPTNIAEPISSAPSGPIAPISTVFDTSATPKTVEQTSLINQDARPVTLEVQNGNHTDVEFKSNRAPENNAAALGHIIDMTGPAPTMTDEPSPADVAPTPVKADRRVVIPELDTIQLPKTIKPPSAPIGPNISSTDSQTSTAFDPSLLDAPAAAAGPIATTGTVTSNPNLPFPQKPDTPNRVVGMVIDPQGNPLPNAIVEILTPNGLPARAVKTNPLGQFFVTTPLSAGQYVVKVEKEPLQFPIQQLVVENKIIDPIEIRAA
jgi:hypothetical protein